jgi:hypothetical protein
MLNRDETPAHLIKRHEEETAAAQAATGREARIVHLELAMRYALLAARCRQSSKDADDRACEKDAHIISDF